MVKISLGGYDDGEGPSNRTHKRRREDDDDDEEEEQQQQRSFEMVDPSIGTQEQEDHAAPPHDGSNSNANGAGTSSRDRSVPIFVSDPDVLDCCICYEPLAAPVFQVNFPPCPCFSFF